MSRTDTGAARAVIVAWLTVMWVLLWGSLTLANVVSGLLAGIALVAVFPPVASRDDPLVVRPLAAASFLGWFALELVKTNLAVAREVLLPPSRSRIRTAVVAVPLRTRSARLATIIANTITLTPGTLTIDARGRPAVLFVHVLSFDDVAGTRRDVAALEARVVRAFGSSAEVARLGAPAPAHAPPPTDGPAPDGPPPPAEEAPR